MTAIRVLPALIAVALCVSLAPAQGEPERRWPPMLRGSGWRDQPPQWTGCPDLRRPARGAVTAIDISDQLNDALLNRMEDDGVSTIIRYYDWKEDARDYPNFDYDWPPGETKPGKTLTQNELNILARHEKISLVVVFQHLNDQMETYLDRKRATFDAERALELARQFKQPPGTTIYFGVDGADERFLAKYRATGNRFYRNNGRAHIVRYFRRIEAIFKQRGDYDLGAYGSGFICRTLKDEEKIVKHCWLSMSVGHLESKGYERNGDWTLKQCAERKAFKDAPGVGFDPDLINPKRTGNFGQWRPPKTSQACSDRVDRRAASGACGGL